mgnify:CR=1 FL=1
MDRLTLERRQVWIYLAAIAGGLVLGTVAPEIGPRFEVLLWSVPAALLYTTFVQVPLLHVRDAFRDRRFVLAILLGNFVLIPLVLWLALQWLPGDPALRLGVLLVLLVPCTDWFITFTQLGRGTPARAIAVTPLNLLAQLLLLPVYLWLMLPVADFSAALKTEEMLPAALALIGLPLVAAALSERWVEARTERAIWRERLGWWPVPLLAVVVFLIAGVHAPAAIGRWVYGGLSFLVAAIGAGVAGRHVWLQSLPPDQVPACGPGFDYMIDAFPLSKALSMIFTGSGECAEVDWQFLGLSMPWWTLIAFIGLGVWALLAAAAARRRGT